MKLIIQDNRIAATATDDYDGQDGIPEPADFDILLMDQYRRVDGKLIIPVPESITAMQGLLAIDQAGLSGAYEIWANDPSRTFAERTFIQRATVWKRNDPLLVSAATSFGLSGADIDALFITANAL